MNSIGSNQLIVASAQHTGTWFALDFLLWHSAVSRVVELHKLDGELLPKDVLHFHLVGSSEVSYVHPLDEEKCWSVVEAAKLIEQTRTVIPIRDPLAALVTRQERHPELSHRHIVDAYADFSLLKTACMLPVDLPTTYEERLALLITTLEKLDLEVEPYVLRYARDWKPQNTRGEYKLKRLYEENELADVEKMLGDDFDYLLSQAPAIIPFLKGLGYTNLPWWERA